MLCFSCRFRALASRCNNAPYPDKYGHYREVSIVQIKHHWWWKVNYTLIFSLFDFISEIVGCFVVFRIEMRNIEFS